MYKSQLQELAQRSCFNLPSYACVREGPDHAPRFKASVNFLGEIFQGQSNCTTLRQAENAAAEVALTTLSTKGPSRYLTAEVLDETSVYKNLLQKSANRAGLKLPVYTTVRTGPRHQPVFTCTVELAGLSFNGESAKTKKQAEKNAALAAWSALKQMPDFGSCYQQSKKINNNGEECEQVAMIRLLRKLSCKEGRSMNQSNRKPYWRKRRVLESRECFPSLRNATGYNQHKWEHSGPSDLWSNRALQLPHQRCLLVHTGTQRMPSYPLFHQTDSSIQESFSSEDNRTGSLLSILNKSLPVYLRSEKQLQSDDIKAREEPIIDNVAKDQNSHYAIKKGSELIHAPLYARAFPLLNTSSTQVEARPFDIKPIVKTTASAYPAKSSQVMQIPAMFATGSYSSYGVAPAVNIRTVIPVCANPPIRLAGNTTKSMTVASKEEMEVLETSSILRKLQL